LRGAAGLDGWQWLFLVEGTPAVILGIVALAYLTDRPEQARWLPEDEKAWLVEALARERETASRPGMVTARAGLLDPLVWRLALCLFLIVTSGYGFSFFLPQIVKTLSGGSDLRVGLLTALPFSVAAVGMATVAAHSDRTGERRMHVAACGATAAIGLAVAATSGSPVVALVALAFAAVGLYSYTPPFWSLPTAFLRGDGAAAGIGLINAVGNLGGFIGPYLMGWLRDWSGDFATGLYALAASALFSGALVLTVRGPKRPALQTVW
jgi:ACS family tartrate transporter-like MFS transporter